MLNITLQNQVIVIIGQWFSIDKWDAKVGQREAELDLQIAVKDFEI